MARHGVLQGGILSGHFVVHGLGRDATRNWHRVRPDFWQQAGNGLVCRCQSPFRQGTGTSLSEPVPFARQNLATPWRPGVPNRPDGNRQPPLLKPRKLVVFLALWLTLTAQLSNLTRVAAPRRNHQGNVDDRFAAGAVQQVPSSRRRLHRARRVADKTYEPVGRKMTDRPRRHSRNIS